MSHLTCDNEEDRVEKLNLLIDLYYAMKGPDQLAALAREYEGETMVMFEVKRVLAEALAVESFEGVTYSPVILPADLRALVKPEDVFLGSLALRHGVWHVLYLSPLHEPMYFDEEDEEVWDESPLH